MKKIQIAATVIVAIFAFIFGIKVADLRKNTVDGEYSKFSEYDNIKIFSYEGFDKVNAQSYLEDLAALPKKLTDNCENIYFTDENLNEKFSLEIETQIVALSFGRDIYISTDYHGTEVLVHELYHVYDYANDWISDTDEFKELYELYKDEHEVSPGNVQNCYEFFASYGENFYLRNETLNDDTLFAFFDNLNIL